MRNKRSLSFFVGIRSVCLTVFTLVVAVPALLQAQSFTASVRGVVTDPSQAAVPAAKVTVIDISRNRGFTAQTDAAGRYIITALPPGTYTLSAEAEGFQKYLH